MSVTVKGSIRDADDAKRSIMELVSSNSNWHSDRNGGGGGGGGNGGRQFDHSNNSRNHDSRNDSSRNFERRNRDSSRSNDTRSSETLEIYPDKVGSVIGRGGETIRNIQESFKVRVNIDKNTSIVTVSGSQGDVTRAIARIKELTGEPNESRRNDGFGSQPQQNNQAPESMEFEVIDWQAAARESVS